MYNTDYLLNINVPEKELITLSYIYKKDFYTIYG